MKSKIATLKFARISSLWDKRKASYPILFRIFARGIASVTQAIFLLFLAREYGASEFGKLSVLIGLGYFLSALFGLGSTTRILRIRAEKNPRVLATSLLYIRFISSLLGVIPVYFVGMNWNQSVVIMAILIVLCDSLVEYSQSYLAGIGRASISSVLVIAQRVLPLAGIGVVIAGGSYAFLYFTLAAMIFVGLYFPFMGRSRTVSMRGAIRSSFGYWFSGLASSSGQLQSPLLSAVLDSASVGAYAVAARMTNPLTIVVSAAQTVLVPELAARKGTSEFVKVMKISYLLSTSYACLLFLFSWPLAIALTRFLGKDYANYVLLIIAMIGAAGLSAIAYAFQGKLMAIGRPDRVATSVGIGNAAGLGGILLIGFFAGSEWIWVVPLFSQLIVVIGLWRVSRNL